MELGGCGRGGTGACCTREKGVGPGSPEDKYFDALTLSFFLSQLRIRPHLGMQTKVQQRYRKGGAEAETDRRALHPTSGLTWEAEEWSLNQEEPETNVWVLATPPPLLRALCVHLALPSSWEPLSAWETAQSPLALTQ